MSVLYHSAFGGDLIFEDENSLEHASKNPGNYGLKNTGRDKYTGLYRAADEAKNRQITREQIEAQKIIKTKFNRFCDNLKTKINIRTDDNRNYNHQQITDAYKEASSYEVTINFNGDITIGDLVLVKRSEA